MPELHLIAKDCIKYCDLKKKNKTDILYIFFFTVVSYLKVRLAASESHDKLFSFRRN